MVRILPKSQVGNLSFEHIYKRGDVVAIGNKEDFDKLSLIKQTLSQIKLLNKYLKEMAGVEEK